MLEVERYRLLVAIQPDEMGSEPSHGFVVVPGGITPIAILHLDYPGPEIA
jgi:hypothetical protein